MSSSRTDFGNIYSKTPSKVFSPKTIEELSDVLRDLNSKAIPVVVRNTGYSVNGQTLTDGVQVLLGDMRWTRFDEAESHVTVGAGVSWDGLFQAIRFPEYCTPVFPDYPGQEVHVTGTLAVGGIGNYSVSAGGIWNHVRRIRVVTMDGSVFSCSRTENPELFQYSLGGFGRVGIIAEATMEVVKSPKTVSPVSMIVRNQESLARRLNEVAEDRNLSGVVFGFGRVMIRGIRGVSFRASAILTLTEKGSDIPQGTRKKTGFGTLNRHPLIRDDRTGTVPKRDVVYQSLKSFAPQNQDDGLCHPWSDYIIPLESVERFNRRLEKLLKAYRLDEYGISEPIAGTPLRVRFEAIGFMARRMEYDFPLLSFDIPEQDVVVGVGCWLAIPRERLDDAKAFVRDMTEYCYALGGKRYMYGWHELTKAQVRQQFGDETIQTWNGLKRRFDPSGLLNRDVIEHLDKF